MSAELIEWVHRIGQPQVLVIGDVMLDRYIWGDAARISQEAPVILLRADRREERLGGASSVATMLRALGGKVMLIGAVGQDEDARRVRSILNDLGIRHDGLIAVEDRPTTVKERYIGRAQHRHPQQMLRVDYERDEALNTEAEDDLLAALRPLIRRSDIVLMSDYGKGVCTPRVTAEAIALARQCGIPVLVDPQRGGDYRKYHGCTAMTPNRLEAGLALGCTVSTTASAIHAAHLLQQQLDMEAAIITLDKDGMVFAHRDGRAKHLSTRPRQVYDITGAGDMVLAMLGMALAAGADYGTALALANVAGGLEVEKIGVATITRDEILRDLLHHSCTATDPDLGEASKVQPLEQILREIDVRRRMGQRVAFTNGCFDILHAGHVDYLQAARAQADVLIVGLNSDASVRRLKGEDRPINPIEMRARVLAALRSVDFITVFDADTPIELIQAIRPDVLVKGADYRKEDVVGAEFVESYGGTVFLAPLTPGHSTTRIVERLKAA